MNKPKEYDAYLEMKRKRQMMYELNKQAPQGWGFVLGWFTLIVVLCIGTVLFMRFYI